MRSRQREEGERVQSGDTNGRNSFGFRKRTEEEWSLTCSHGCKKARYMAYMAPGLLRDLRHGEALFKEVLPLRL